MLILLYLIATICLQFEHNCLSSLFIFVNHVSHSHRLLRTYVWNTFFWFVFLFFYSFSSVRVSLLAFIILCRLQFFFSFVLYQLLRRTLTNSKIYCNWGFCSFFFFAFVHYSFCFDRCFMKFLFFPNFGNEKKQQILICFDLSITF